MYGTETSIPQIVEWSELERDVDRYGDSILISEIFFSHALPKGSKFCIRL